MPGEGDGDMATEGRRLVGATVAATMAAALISMPGAAHAAPASAPAVDSPQITELIVAYEPGVTPSEAPGVATGSAAISSDVTLATGDAIGFGLRTVGLSAPVDEATAERLAAELSNTPGVRYAEPNSIVTLADVQPGAPWGLDRIDQPALPLDTSYQYPTGSKGSGVTAYVIDTGILAGHAEFGGRVAAGYDGVGDGNGSSDCNGHGTHVAGTLGGATYGVAKQVTLVPVRVFGCTGGTTIDAVVSGINWVVAQHTSGPAVANLSLSAGVSTALDDAVTALIADGVTAVVAAGNANVDSCTRSPARVASAITVNASDSADARASFSNYGSCSDLYAPGVDIMSAWWTSTTATNTISGTSMATPHVAGVAARILGANPGYTPAQVSSAILNAASAVTFSPASPDPDLLLFADPGVLVTAPGSPTSVQATAGNASATITWVAPASTGGSPLTGYTARAYAASSGGSSVATCQPSPATEVGCTIAGLSNGVTYYVDVIAANAYFPSTGSPSSPRVPVTPAGVVVAPSAPQSVSATPGNASLAVIWSAPASTGGATIDSYTARAYSAASGGTSAGSCSTAALGCTVSGLTNGTEYFVEVFATNSAGNGTASSPRFAAVPATTPSAPRSVAATAGENQASVTWTAPSSNGGSSITGYTARAWTAATGGSTTATCQPAVPTGLGCTITGLTGATTYYVDVVATNEMGTGSAPAARVTVTPTAPPAPPASGGGGGGGGGSSAGSSAGGGGGDSTWLVKEVRPSSGPPSGGTTALIIGYGFTGATRVTVGGAVAPGFRFINDGTIEIITPPGSLGWQDLVVWLPNGSVPAGFQYTTAAATPNVAPVSTPSSPSADPADAPASSGATPIGPAASPIVRPTATMTARIPVTAVGRSSGKVASAPTVTGRTGDAFKLRVLGLPSSANVIAQIRIDGRYYALGSVRTNGRGVGLLPTFAAQRPGTYLVKVRVTPGSARYIRVVVR